MQEALKNPDFKKIWERMNWQIRLVKQTPATWYKIAELID
jgi:hypothetical protein